MDEDNERYEIEYGYGPRAVSLEEFEDQKVDFKLLESLISSRRYFFELGYLISESYREPLTRDLAKVYNDHPKTGKLSSFTIGAIEKYFIKKRYPFLPEKFWDLKFKSFRYWNEPSTKQRLITESQILECNQVNSVGELKRGRTSSLVYISGYFFTEDDPNYRLIYSPRIDSDRMLIDPKIVPVMKLKDTLRTSHYYRF